MISDNSLHVCFPSTTKQTRSAWFKFTNSYSYSALAVFIT